MNSLDLEHARWVDAQIVVTQAKKFQFIANSDERRMLQRKDHQFRVHYPSSRISVRKILDPVNQRSTAKVVN